MPSDLGFKSLLYRSESKMNLCRGFFFLRSFKGSIADMSSLSLFFNSRWFGGIVCIKVDLRGLPGPYLPLSCLLSNLLQVHIQLLLRILSVDLSINLSNNLGVKCVY